MRCRDPPSALPPTWQAGERWAWLRPTPIGRVVAGSYQPARQARPESDQVRLAGRAPSVRAATPPVPPRRRRRARQHQSVPSERVVSSSPSPLPFASHPFALIHLICRCMRFVSCRASLLCRHSACDLGSFDLPSLAEHRQQDHPSAGCQPIADPYRIAFQVETQFAGLPDRCREYGSPNVSAWSARMSAIASAFA